MFSNLTISFKPFVVEPLDSVSLRQKFALHAAEVSTMVVLSNSRNFSVIVIMNFYAWCVIFKKKQRDFWRCAPRLRFAPARLRSALVFEWQVGRLKFWIWSLLKDKRGLFGLSKQNMILMLLGNKNHGYFQIDHGNFSDNHDHAWKNIKKSR